MRKTTDMTRPTRNLTAEDMLFKQLDERFAHQRELMERDRLEIMASIERNKVAAEQRAASLELKINPIVTAFAEARGMKRMALLLWTGGTLLLSALAGLIAKHLDRPF